MLTLSEETETLARRLAIVQNQSIDATVRRALEQQAETAGVESRVEPGQVSEEEVARRKGFCVTSKRKSRLCPSSIRGHPKRSWMS